MYECTSFSLFVFDVSSADPEGGTGGPDPPPWKITSYMGFYKEIGNGPPEKSWTPTPGKCWPPLEP